MLAFSVGHASTWIVVNVQVHTVTHTCKYISIYIYVKKNATTTIPSRSSTPSVPEKWIHLLPVLPEHHTLVAHQRPTVQGFMRRQLVPQLPGRPVASEEHVKRI